MPHTNRMPYQTLYTTINSRLQDFLIQTENINKDLQMFKSTREITLFFHRAQISLVYFIYLHKNYSEEK